MSNSESLPVKTGGLPGLIKKILFQWQLFKKIVHNMLQGVCKLISIPIFAIFNNLEYQQVP